MKKTHLLLIFLILLVSCQQSIQTDQTTEEYQAEVKETIAQFNGLWFEAWEKGDLDSTLTFLDEGFINMFGFPLSQTKEQCREAWVDIFNTYSVEDVEYESVELNKTEYRFIESRKLVGPLGPLIYIIAYLSNGS